jgi:hypothetical protein
MAAGVEEQCLVTRTGMQVNDWNGLKTLLLLLLLFPAGSHRSRETREHNSC